MLSEELADPSSITGSHGYKVNLIPLPLQSLYHGEFSLPPTFMSFPSMYSLATIVIVLILLLPYVWRRLRAFPRGPTGLPFIGNLLDVTSSEQWRTAAGWSKKYGES
jgi:hypothetical protein